MVLSIVMLTSMGSVFAEDVGSEAEPKYIPNAIVITIYAGYSSESSIGGDDYGHAYITVENFTNSPITVGKLSVGNGKGVSIGGWNDDNEHEGLYYNRELRFNDRNYWSYSTTINLSQLSSLTSYILSNDRWSPQYNCSVFAGYAWNTATGQSFGTSYYDLPGELANRIRTFSTAQYGTIISQSYPVYYANGYGNIVLSRHN